MNLISGAPLWSYYLLLACLGAAAVEDIFKRRISNVVSGAVALLALTSAVYVGPEWQFWQNLVLFAGVLAVGTIAFAHGMLGGGDIKLLSAVSLWVPFSMAWRLLIAITLAGGVLALFCLAVWTIRRTPRGPNGKREIPYAVAIALGSAFIFATSRI